MLSRRRLSRFIAEREWRCGFGVVVRLLSCGPEDDFLSECWARCGGCSSCRGFTAVPDDVGRGAACFDGLVGGVTRAELVFAPGRLELLPPKLCRSERESCKDKYDYYDPIENTSVTLEDLTFLWEWEECVA